MGDLKKVLLEDLSKNEKSLLNKNANGKELLDDQLDGVAGGSGRVYCEFAFREGDVVIYNNSKYIIYSCDSRGPQYLIYPVGEKTLNGKINVFQDELLRYNKPTQKNYKSGSCDPVVLINIL